MLLKRIDQAANRGRVLDVSWMTDSYLGIKMITKPGPRSRKIGVEGLPIVSDNIGKYEIIIKALGPKYSSYLDIYKYMKDQKPEVLI